MLCSWLALIRRAGGPGQISACPHPAFGPILVAVAQPQTPKELTMAERLEGKTILMVDDDEEIISAMQLALADTGAAIHTARDGNMGLDKAGKLNPDLIILDIMLPQRS